MIPSLLAFIGTYPSVLTLLWWISQGTSALNAICFDVILRVARCSGQLLHEHAHLIVALALTGQASEVFTIANCLGNVPLRRQLLQLLPGVTCPSCTCVSLPGCKDFPASALVASGGLFMSALLLFAARPALDCPFFIAALLNFSSALVSDGPLLMRLATCHGVFGCGNWGLLCPASLTGDKKLFSPYFIELLTNIIDVCELRGAQAGGVHTFLQKQSCWGKPSLQSVVARVVKHKRGHLAQTLFTELRKQLRRQQLCNLGRLRQSPIMLAQGHSRFGTSSAPSVIDTHPHQWEPAKKELLWKFNSETRLWEVEMVHFSIVITHNGDFDGWRPYDEMVGNREIGLWLERILQYPNHSKGDSPKLAGLMNLMITKGSWFRSVRLSWALHVMTHIEHAFDWQPMTDDAPNGMAPLAWLEELAAVFHQAFKHHLLLENTPDKMYLSKSLSFGEKSIVNGIVLSELVSDVEKYLDRTLSDLATQRMEAYIPNADSRKRFVAATVENFLTQDSMTAVWQFFQRAEGSFGVSVTCSADASAVVLASRGQPITVGCDPLTSLALWTSEPVSLASRWSVGGYSAPAAKMRLDLQDTEGEILELRVVPGQILKTAWSSLSLSPVAQCPFIPISPEHVGQSLSKHPGNTILFRGCSMDVFPVPLSEHVLAHRFVSLQATTIDSPLKAMRPGAVVKSRSTRDPVGDDIKKIPAVLREVDRTWDDETSLNFQSSLRFSNFLFARARARNEYKPQAVQEIDLLVTGVEGSHWLGQQFVADVTRCFPTLRAVALSSNFVLGLLQKSEGRVVPLGFPFNGETFKMGKGAVCLVISQSGTTYPSVWAARLLSRLEHCHVFAMSGHFDTVLATSVAAQKATEGGFSQRVFSSMAGVRPCEPSTVATAAMHHTLSRLLLSCVREGLAEESMPLVRNLNADDLERMVGSLASSVESICGVTADGAPISSPTNTRMLQMARHWASHLTEVYWATFLGALYVLVSVTFGVPVITTIWTHVGKVVDLEDVPIEVPHAVDALIYVFLAALISIVHRLLTGRRLWTRFTSRTVVIVEASTANYKLLRAYVSKLRALAFRFTTFTVMGQNGTDHFVHEMTHLTTSETLLAVGRPDGRLASLAATEASLIMSINQAKFIKKGNTGVEAMSLGHNPWTDDRLFTDHIPLPVQSRPVFFSETFGAERAEQNFNRQDGMHPQDAIQKFAALRAGMSTGQRQVPKISFSELQELAGHRPTVEVPAALQIISQLLESQEAELGIKAKHVDTDALIDISNDPDSPSVGASTPRRSAFSTSATSSLKGSKNGYKQNMLPPNGTSIRLSSILSPRGSGRGGRNGTMLEVQVGCISLTTLMGIIRSSAMKKAVKAARKHNACALANMSVCFLKSDISVQKVLLQWKGYIERRRCLKKDASEHSANWRWDEAYRTAVSSNQLSRLAWGIPLRAFLTAWRSLVTSAVKEDIFNRGKAYVVGSKFNTTDSGVEGALAAQEVSEHLYETRVAAAERLISFFVFFHAMVKPISLLPVLGFDMDRTESRLRVSSTPAPVAMRVPFGQGCVVASPSDDPEVSEVVREDCEAVEDEVVYYERSQKIEYHEV